MRQSIFDLWITWISSKLQAFWGWWKRPVFQCFHKMPIFCYFLPKMSINNHLIRFVSLKINKSLADLQEKIVFWANGTLICKIMKRPAPGVGSMAKNWNLENVIFWAKIPNFITENYWNCKNIMIKIHLVCLKHSVDFFVGCFGPKNGPKSCPKLKMD